MIGNYEIIGEIAEGGMGRVFQARHKELDELACLKQNIDATHEAYGLLKNEAKLLWKLSEHHSIPSTKDFFELDKHNGVMVMDYIEGETIDSAVSAKGRLHPEDAAWVVERLLGALYYIHYHGVVHGDIKPQNVIVEATKHDIKLIDFGLANIGPGRHSTPSGYTELYCAPELLNGKPPIPESDLYGAGIIMMYALGGDIRKRTYPHDTPQALQEYCNRLLRYNPMDRPNWKSNLIKELSDARLEAFGRRRSSG